MSVNQVAWLLLLLTRLSFRRFGHYATDKQVNAACVTRNLSRDLSEQCENTRMDDGLNFSSSDPIFITQFCVL